MHRICLLLVLLILPACHGASEADRPFLTRTLTTADGETAHYVLFVPVQRNPDQKLPVILFLNGWGENGDDGLRQISNNFGGDLWRMRAEFPFLAVCPQCSYEAEWTPGSKNGELALAVLDAAIREFNGDPERVSITGASTGGSGALSLALAHPQRFAAVVPISAAIHVAPADLLNSQIPVWSFHNRGDASGLVRLARETRRQHLVAGSSPLVTEFNQGGHNAWDAAYSSPALYRWLLEQRSGSTDPRLPFAPLAPQRVLADWTRTGPDVWTIEDADLVAPPASRNLELISPAWTGDWALHLDLQIEQGQPGALALIDAADARHELLLPLADEGASRLATADGVEHRTDPFAQRALRSGWNDIRIELRDRRLSVTANGWPMLQGHPLPGESIVRIALVKKAGAAEQRFRYLRVSPDAWGAAAP